MFGVDEPQSCNRLQLLVAGLQLLDEAWKGQLLGGGCGELHLRPNCSTDDYLENWKAVSCA